MSTFNRNSGKPLHFGPAGMRHGAFNPLGIADPESIASLLQQICAEGLRIFTPMAVAVVPGLSCRRICGRSPLPAQNGSHKAAKKDHVIPEGSTERRLVWVRKHHQKFRDPVWRHSKGRCAVSKSECEGLLVASHIFPSGARCS